MLLFLFHGGNHRACSMFSLLPTQHGINFEESIIINYASTGVVEASKWYTCE